MTKSPSYFTIPSFNRRLKTTECDYIPGIGTMTMSNMVPMGDDDDGRSALDLLDLLAN